MQTFSATLSHRMFLCRFPLWKVEMAEPVVQGRNAHDIARCVLFFFLLSEAGNPEETTTALTTL